MTTATKITLFRVLLIPAFMVLLIESAKQGSDTLRYLALAVFAFASATDFVDGYIARKYAQVSDFGKFLDPLADKLLVTSCMIIFCAQGRMADWVVFVVIAREFAVSGLRMVAAANGSVIAAGWSGKIKTCCTMIGLILMLFFVGSTTLDYVVSMVIFATTIISGIDYFIQNSNVLFPKS